MKVVVVRYGRRKVYKIDDDVWQAALVLIEIGKKHTAASLIHNKGVCTWANSVADMPGIKIIS